MKVLILAGGYGTRLGELVKDIPKALLDVNGKPLINYVMDKIKPLADLEEVVVVTNNKFYDVLLDWADKNCVDYPVNVSIVNDGTNSNEDRLGSIGDMQFIFEKEESLSDWIVIGSDNIFDAPLGEFHTFCQQKSPNVTIGLYDVKELENASKYGVVAVDENQKVFDFQEKPNVPKSTLITMCLYYFPKETLSKVKDYLDTNASYDAAGGYIQWLFQKSDVYGFKFDGKWYDIGSIESYKDAQNCFSN